MLRAREKVADSGRVVWQMPPGPIKVRDSGEDKIAVDCYCGKKFWWHCKKRPKSGCPKCHQQFEIVSKGTD